MPSTWVPTLGIRDGGVGRGVRHVGLGGLAAGGVGVSEFACPLVVAAG